MKYKKYPSYKDSGVEWLGEIPCDWNLVKLKYLVSITTGNKDTENKEQDGKYPFFVRSKNVERINSYSYDGEAILTAGDGDIGKIFHYINGKFDYHQRVYMFYKFKNILVKFLYFYLQENLYKEVIKLSAKTTVDSLRLPMLQDFIISIPSIQEQKQIAIFLDNATAKIDTLIVKQTKLIEILKEKRQAVISHAVTKGINPDVKMKDSGVEWLGDVPEHWESCLLKHHTIKVTDGAHISPELEGGKHYFLSVKDITTGQIVFDNALLTSEESYKYMVKTGCKPEIGDILFGKDGTIGVTSIVETNIPFVVASSLIIIRPSIKQFSKFINYCCISNFFQEQVNGFVKGAGLKRLSIQNLLKIYSTFPPLTEQKEIATYLDDKTKKIDTLIKKATKSIKLLKEKRTALISAAVTGKIDVREII